MAPVFDPSRSSSPPLTHLFTSALTLGRHFNEATYSDLTIKFSGRERKCHKMILCDSSDYFKALCGPHSRFSEAHSSVIELHEDEPNAVEAVLRSIYGFNYPTIQECCGPFTAQDHINIILAAQKYLLPRLEMQAVTGLETTIAITESDLIVRGDAETMLDLIILLTEQSGFSGNFVATPPDLVRSYMTPLFKLKRFRSWLETDEGRHAFDIAMQAIAWGSKVLGEAESGKVRQQLATRCPNQYCRAVVTDRRLGHGQVRCPGCRHVLSNVVPDAEDEVVVVVVGKAKQAQQTAEQLKIYR